MNNFFDYFDAIYCINLDCRTDRWEAVQREFDRVGIRERVVRFSAIETPGNGHAGCMLSHRAIIQKAKDMWWENVLVFEDDVVFIGENLIKNLPKKMPRHWSLFYLGGLFVSIDKPFLEPCNDFLRGAGIRWTQAISYNSNVYTKLLGKLPSKNDDSMWSFLKRYKTIDYYLSCFFQNRCNTFITNTNMCRQRIGFSNIENRTTDYDYSQSALFERILQWSKYQVFYRKNMRVFFQVCWFFQTTRK